MMDEAMAAAEALERTHTAQADELLREAFQSPTPILTADMLARQEACPCPRWSCCAEADEDQANAEYTFDNSLWQAVCVHMVEAVWPRGCLVCKGRLPLEPGTMRASTDICRTGKAV